MKDSTKLCLQYYLYLHMYQLYIINSTYLCLRMYYCISSNNNDIITYIRITYDIMYIHMYLDMYYISIIYQ